VNMTAARIGLLLLETWEGSGGRLDYDPVTVFGSELTISEDTSGPDSPGGFTKLDSYRVLANRADFLITLSYKNGTENEPNALNASIGWIQNSQGEGSSDYNKTFRLTTYVHN